MTNKISYRQSTKQNEKKNKNAKQKSRETPKGY